MPAPASSNGSAQPGTFERRASKIVSQAGLGNLVQDMARAVDGMRAEIGQMRADLTEILDLLKHGAE